MQVVIRLSKERLLVTLPKFPKIEFERKTSEDFPNFIKLVLKHSGGSTEERKVL